ncbi:MAG TPA: RNA polymerase sigma factor [Candidatus Limnocylindria bacterium]|nr:RNA polymerase sigma factor [Candidatus Limnocylindria bacterium]
MESTGQYETPDAPIPLSGHATHAAGGVTTGLYDAHQRELFTFLLASTRDRAVAEDLLQETFLRLVHEVQADRLPLNPRAWLYRVAANLLVSRARHINAEGRWARRQPPPGVVQSLESSFLERERQERLVNGLGELQMPARIGLVMAAHGFTGPEIAAALERSESATRTLLCRARLRLREILAEEGASA